jgi:hypothetical protein
MSDGRSAFPSGGAVLVRLWLAGMALLGSCVVVLYVLEMALVRALVGE